MEHSTPGICSCITQTIGSTPLIQLKRVSKAFRPRILAKLEYFSPSGSIKDPPQSGGPGKSSLAGGFTGNGKGVGGKKYRS